MPTGVIIAPTLPKDKALPKAFCKPLPPNLLAASGIIPAPEGNHAVKGAIDAALECKEKGESKTILFNLCGHGHFDMTAYDDYFSGKLADDIYDEDSANQSLSKLPEIA